MLSKSQNWVERENSAQSPFQKKKTLPKIATKPVIKVFWHCPSFTGFFALFQIFV